ncbi:MAG TPA: hypothetical protein V6C65_24320 [Allocoleopsis sp.]
MTHDSIQAPYPDHKYDFFEPVFVTPLGQGGFIQGICPSQDGKHWLYSLSHPLQPETPWWREDHLKQACPRCLMPWDGLNPCPSCGAVWD